MHRKIRVKYMGFMIIFYAITFWYFQEFLNYTFVVEGITDKYYCYQFAVIYLVGCNFMDKTFSYTAYTRLESRRGIVSGHTLLYISMAFFQVSILYFIGIIHYLIMDSCSIDFDLTVVIINYLLLLTATILLSMLTLCFKYSGKKMLRQYPQIVAYIVLLIEVMAFSPNMRRGFYFPNRILFTWMFYEKSVINIVVLILYSVCLWVLLMHIAGRGDWE